MCQFCMGDVIRKYIGAVLTFLNIPQAKLLGCNTKLFGGCCMSHLLSSHQKLGGDFTSHFVFPYGILHSRIISHQKHETVGGNTRLYVNTLFPSMRESTRFSHKLPLIRVYDKNTQYNFLLRSLGYFYTTLKS